MSEFMQRALVLAQQAADLGEVPVGAVVVKDGVMIAEGFNRREIDKRATAHAELLAIEAACQALGSWRLLGCELYVTLEPCLMCAGAIIQARIPKVVFGATDPKGGATGTLYDVHNDARLNHQFEIEADCCGAESAALLQSFFRARRKKG